MNKERIETSIKQLVSSDLYKGSLDLLASLGYKSENTFTLDDTSFLGIKTLVFSEMGKELHEEKCFSLDWLECQFLFQYTPEDSNDLFKKKNSPFKKIDSFLFVALDLKQDHYTKTELVSITRELNKPFQMPVILLFRYGRASHRKATLSVIDRRISKSKDPVKAQEMVLEKVSLVHNIDLNNPHRAHIDILWDLSIWMADKKKSIQTFLDLYEAWRIALDTKELNNRFYREIFNWYLWASKYVKFPFDFPSYHKDKSKEFHSIALIRLLTRLIFVWFIKEKNLISEELFEEASLKKMLKNFSPNKGKVTSFYTSILQNLFFATLNTFRNGDDPENKISRRFRSKKRVSGQADDYMIHSLYRYEDEFIDKEQFLRLMEEIPFLNGGLFECLDKKPKKKEPEERIDCFSDVESKKPIFPDYLFFSEDYKIDLSEEYGDKKYKSETANGLILILRKYKFTIEENTPIEQEVALDPELLGKVFESLLASFNPETSTTARKQTGSFYTPREIVNYMVDESLIAYLGGVLALEQSNSSILLEDQPNKIHKQDACDTFAESTLEPYLSPDDILDISKRNLPHFTKKDAVYFVTFHLADSIPSKNIEQLKIERENWKKKHNEPYTEKEIVEYFKLFSQKTEELLNAGHGSCLFNDPENVKIVAEALNHFNQDRYILDEWIIMPNHVHVIVKPIGDNSLSEILHSWKSYTANQINKRIGKSGQLWMHESYDHIIRNEKALNRIREYIRDNPIKAGIKSSSITQSNSSILLEDQKSTLSSSTSKDACDTFVESALRQLLSHTNTTNPFNEQDTKKLVSAIQNCKIIDPACGSGAFPMGVLHKLVLVLSKLDPKNELWKQEQLNLNTKEMEELKDSLRKIEKDIQTANEIETNSVKQNALKELEDKKKSIEFHFSNVHGMDYARKLYLIENCIYGVDIQPIAIQISKLRFFISLIIEQKIDHSKSNYGIIPLPNLETKFVAANTLIGLEEPELDQLVSQKDPKLMYYEERIKEIRKKYFYCRSYKEKMKLKEKDEQYRNEIYKIFIEKNERVKKNLSDALKPAKISDKGLKQILNQIDDSNTKTIQELQACIKEVCTEQKIDVGYTKKAIEYCKTYFPPKTASQIAQWAPYMQNETSDWFDPKYMFEIHNGFDVVIGNPPYGASYKDNEKKYFINNYYSAKTIPNKQKGSLDTFTLFTENGFKHIRNKGNLIFIVPISITSSDSMSALHHLLESNCEEIRISSYSVRPQPIFQNAVVNTAILFFTKTNTKCKKIYTTKMYRKNENLDLNYLLENLKFINAIDYKLVGRYPKISYSIEKNILSKIFSKKNTAIKDLIKEKGHAIYYRTTGGRYYKVITNYSTGSTKEKPIYFDKKIANTIGAFLSSNLYFWFYQIYSNNLDLKMYEIEVFRIPIDYLDDERIKRVNHLYKEYLHDIERNCNVRKTENYTKIDSFKEYKIGKSKELVDLIDDFICPLYDMTEEEIDFIKNYEIRFRVNDYE